MHRLKRYDFLQTAAKRLSIFHGQAGSELVEMTRKRNLEKIEIEKKGQKKARPSV